MSTDTNLANYALGLIAQDPIPNLLPASAMNNKVIVAINEYLAQVKESMLRARDWNCARRRAALAEVTNESLGEWAYAYRTPADCLAVRRFVGERTGCRSPFAWEIDSASKRILYCNVQNAKIVYTANITDVNRWDKLLFNACGAMLAARLAGAWGRDTKLAEKFMGDAFREFDEAYGVDEGESGNEQESSTLFTDVRYGGVLGTGPTNVNR